MRKPIFDQAGLEQIRAAQNPSELVDTRGTDWVLDVKRDRSDIGIPKGTRLLARPQTTAQPGELVVVKVGAEHVLRRYPTDEGPVTGVVLVVFVEVPDD